MDITLDLFTENVDVYKDFALNVTTQLELKFWINGVYPSQAELEDKFQVNGNSFYLIEKKVNSMLQVRGLPPVEWEPTAISKARKSEPDLDPYFVVAVSLVCDTFDKRSRSVKLKAANLTTKQFTAFLQKPKYLEYYIHRVNQAFKGTSESAKLSLSRNVEAGDLQSIKYFHEYTKEFDPNREVQINLVKLVNLLMEILSRHVPTNIIEAVSREFDVKMLELK